MEVTELISLKILRPYHIKVNKKFIHIRLEHQFFSIYKDNEEYQFVPIESKEIRINRLTGKIDNVDATFAFQSGEKLFYISMEKLTFHPQFLNQINNIAKPYYNKTQVDEEVQKTEVELIINELEQINKKKLIDKALDNRDKELFYKLVRKL